MKIGLLDVETSHAIAAIFSLWNDSGIPYDNVLDEWFLICASWKLLEDKKVTAVSVLDDKKAFKKDHKNDLVVVKKLHEFLSSVDVVVGHNCVEVNSRILTQDMRWVAAGSLKVGDKLVGFEEGNDPYLTTRDDGKWRGTGGQARKVKPTEVTDFEVALKPCVRVNFTNGESLVTTRDHFWLGRAEKDNNFRWYKSESLHPGQRINKYWTPWERDTSFEAGWASGFLAGEGSLSQSGPCGGVIQFYQRPGATWERAHDYLNSLGFRTSKDRKVNPTGIGRQDTLAASVLGGKFKVVELMGRLDISRFKEKFDWSRFGGLKGRNENFEILIVSSVEEVGNREVAVFATTTSTFFAEGFAMHNCKKFDIKKFNTRAIYHGLDPLQPIKTVDTLLEARKLFAFTSNRLDALDKFFGGTGKRPTSPGLWLRVLEGEEKAIKEMVEYNKIDVVVLEKLYLKLRPWMTNHPNGNIYNGTTHNCPACGSLNLRKEGWKLGRTGTTMTQQYQCRSCGKWSSGEKMPQQKKIVVK